MPGKISKQPSPSANGGGAESAERVVWTQAEEKVLQGAVQSRKGINDPSHRPMIAPMPLQSKLRDASKKEPAFPKSLRLKD